MGARTGDGLGVGGEGRELGEEGSGVADRGILAELLRQMPDVPDAFLETHAEALLDAVGEVPGVDAARAVVVRLLPRLVPDGAAREPYLQAAGQALRAYPDAVRHGDPVAMMTRHPAWVGLAHLEVVDALGGDPDAAIEVALQHARLGFSTAARGPVQAGEVLWAMAEAAEEVGWLGRAAILLARAAAAEFADPGTRAQALLLAGQLHAATDPVRAEAWLVEVGRSEGPHSLRVQAAFVVSRIREAAGDEAAAVRWLQTAISAVDPDDDPAVRSRLEEELARLGA